MPYFREKKRENKQKKSPQKESFIEIF